MCLDLEGVLIPEIWLGVAERTGEARLTKTTRDIPVYDELMRYRLGILDETGIGIDVVQEVIGGMEPLPGAADFLSDLRTRYQVAILSDTFYEFAMPLMAKLDHPFLLCHRLEIDGNRIAGYRLRQPDPKRASVQALHSLRYRVTAAGDSYNDVAMLEEADAGILFRAPDNVLAEFPEYPHTTEYAGLAELIEAAQ